ncbi:hypothetical protein TRSC58_07441 [Trypanosoma rangeli SC58]|uniref:Uncharacterized protein n=1 Tax=Trypanosoma rangeli SC58 TaxID=429131 RepID=A0A061ISU0_TRYRA|nr:hypothetical protein TRSC58_07441 [Trypanosoma rangeli SC58]
MCFFFCVCVFVLFLPLLHFLNDLLLFLPLPPCTPFIIIVALGGPSGLFLSFFFFALRVFVGYFVLFFFYFFSLVLQRVRVAHNTRDNHGGTWINL